MPVMFRTTTRPHGRLMAVVTSVALAAMMAFPGSVAADAETFEVIVDGHTADNQSAFLAYFPSEISVHPGDTIDFPLWDSGEPHSVTFGTLVDDGLAALADGADPAAEPNLAKLPALLPEGPGDANQVASNPCFIAEGDPPTDACNDAEQPAFDGTQSFFNSGWLGESSGFSVTLADDIAPGTYSFFCLLHRQGMAGSITVVDEATEVATPAEVSQEAVAQIDEAAGKIQAAIDGASANPPGQTLAGVFTPEVLNGFGIAFAQEDISIPVGESVTWTVLGPHTISFNASQEAVGPRVEAPDGTSHINVLAVAPSGGPGQAPPEGEPDPNEPPPLIEAGEWDGTGFLSSGLIVAFPPTPAQYRVAFTEAGTYSYNCLIHPDMKGTVTVVA